MDFKRIKISNFLSIGEAELSLNSGLVGIYGLNKDVQCASSNGAGKSSLFDALYWGLYGKTFRDIAHDDVIRNGAKKATVFIEMTNGDAILRERSRGKTSLSLIISGAPVNALTQTITQDQIDKYLGLDFKTFSSCVMFGQDTLRFIKTSDSEKKVIFGSILNFDYYDLAHELARDRSKELTDSIILKDAERKKCEEAVASGALLIFEYSSRIEKGRLERETSLQTNTMNLDVLRSSLIEKKARYEELCKSIEDNKVSISKYDANKKRLFEISSRLKYLKDEKSKSQHEETKVKDHLEHIKSDSICPLCGNQVTEIKGAELAALYARDIGKIENNIFLINDEMVQLEGELKTLKEENLTAAVPHSEADSFRTLGKEIEELTKSIERKETENKNIASVNDDVAHQILDNFIKDTEQRRQRVKILIDEIVAIENELAVVDFWVTGFGNGGIKSYLLDSIIPFLNSRATYYSDIVTDGSFKIEFSAQTGLKSGEMREKFEVRVLNNHGARNYDGNSAGERQRIELCVMLAVNDLIREYSGRNPGLIIFDEAFERLDESGCERIIALLHKESERFKNIFVITHNESLLSSFDNVIVIEKIEGKSRIWKRKDVPIKS